MKHKNNNIIWEDKILSLRDGQAFIPHSCNTEIIDTTNRFKIILSYYLYLISENHQAVHACKYLLYDLQNGELIGKYATAKNAKTKAKTYLKNRNYE